MCGHRARLPRHDGRGRQWLHSVRHRHGLRLLRQPHHRGGPRHPPRFDLITVNSSGTKAVTAGTASSNPVFPAIPANSIVLAAIYVPAADTDIDANQIIDKRVTVSTYSVPGITVYRCRLKRTVDSGSLTQSSVNYIAWDAEDYDTNTFHDNVTNNTRMTFTTTGLYQVNAFAYINGNATVILNIRKNGTTDIRATKIANGNPQGVGLSFLYDATATDYLEVGVNPSAVSCTVEADYSYFECFRVA